MPTDTPDPRDIATDLMFAVGQWNASTERGKQKQAHRLGISDLGKCREYARWMTIEQAFTDEPNVWPAFVGSAIDRLLLDAVAQVFPKAITGIEVRVTLPSGASYTGHPDLVFDNGVLDNKTVDGLTQVRRQGPTLQQQFQRHLYYAALVQERDWPEDGWVGNVWWDRSGRDPVPHVQVESYDPTWLHRADDWVSDVLYAVKMGERTMQDKPVEWCAAACQFYAVCRTEDVLKDREQGRLIDDDETLDLIEAYKDARETKKEMEHVLDDLRRALADVSGRTTQDVVKWIYVNEAEVPGYTRSGYSKLDIRPIPRAVRK